LFTKVKNKLRTLEQAVHNARAAAELSRLDLPYLPWPGSALAPSALRTILNEIEVNKRKTVVEFGSGISTLYIAKILSRIGGHIVSIENNAEWADLVRGWLAEAGLAGTATLIVAPLGSCSYSLKGLEWYDEKAVLAGISGLKIDCVLVDGPTAYERGTELARYPALLAIEEQLNDSFVVFLDDINRAGEQEVLKKWSDHFGIEFHSHLGRGGIAQGVRGPSFYSAM
jgi:hypothetical protein